MEIDIHFKDDSITPCKYSKGSSNSHTIPCQQMQYIASSSVIRISFTLDDLAQEETKVVVENRSVNNYGDSRQKFIDIPCEELYSASVRTDLR